MAAVVPVRDERHGPRTLSVDPTYKGYAFVVLEGRSLIDWGGADIRSRTLQAFRRRITALADQYRPDLVVIEDVANTRRGPRARRWITALEEIALASEIDLDRVSRSDVQWAFQLTGSTKYQIAVALARGHPELIPHLPRERRPWMAEDHRMNIFDALSFAVVALGRLGLP